MFFFFNLSILKSGCVKMQYIECTIYFRTVLMNCQIPYQVTAKVMLQILATYKIL